MQKDQIQENLKQQLSEIETLQSMFCNPGELQIEDPQILDDIKNYVEYKIEDILPQSLDVNIILNLDDTKFDVRINLPKEYPQCVPNVFVRCEKLNKVGHENLHKDMKQYVAEIIDNGPCIFTIITWIQENATNYMLGKSDNSVLISATDKSNSDVKNNELIVRYWIYSHHIYSKTKIRNIMQSANDLRLTGFCLPGKPGIICVEGVLNDCSQWWSFIKSMNWKRIVLKHTESSDEHNKATFHRFTNFEEIGFQSNASSNVSHTDMGKFLTYLDQHQCGYVFNEIFNMSSKQNS